jgi:peptidoglycan/xylan/chitin deacetylase (PgdA/CDA1 family)
MSGIRFDRWLTLGLFGPLDRLGFGARGFRLPILMYHSISDEPEDGVAPYYQTCTRPAVFARHMALLKSLGYRGVNLNDGLAWLQSSSQPHAAHEPPISGLRSPMFDVQCSALNVESTSFPPSDLRPQISDLGSLTSDPSSSPVVLTFDDGFQDFQRVAFPILQQHGFGATVYLPTAFIGETPRQFKNRACLTWSEVHALHRAGIEFGSHTVHHPRLVDMDWAGIEGELRDSKTTLEQRLCDSVKAFAYPYAFPQTDSAFAGQLRTALGCAGYKSCVTTQIGRVRADDDPFRLRRLPVNSSDDDSLLKAKIEGDYDWLGLPQAMSKTVRYWLCHRGK